jgi:4-hydroxy-tetrahydrodipicolinate reductase
MIRVCLAGVTGWVGRPLAAAIQDSGDLELVVAVARGAAGTRLGSVPIVGSVEESLATPFDVLVDFTSAMAVKANLTAAIAGGRHVVVGSSGLADQDYDELDRLARGRQVGVLAVGNFAISAALLQRFAVEAARYLTSWELIDVAGAGKIDAPSGTARELAWKLASVGRPTLEIPLERTVGPPESRGATINHSQVHSVRLPGYTIGIEARFGGADERLTIVYDAGPGAEPYIRGTLLAIRRVSGFQGVTRGLDGIL